MRRLLKTFFALLLFSLAVRTVPAQITNGTNIGNLDQDRVRTKKIRDARQVIDDYPEEQWRVAAYLLLELTPNEDGFSGPGGSAGATLEIAERDRPKLLGIRKAEPQSATRFLVADPNRIKPEVNYYQAKQVVACSLPKKLRGQLVTLGIFQVYEGQVERFVREVTKKRGSSTGLLFAARLNPRRSVTLVRREITT